MSRTIAIDIETLQLTLSDGKAREFLLTAGGLNRIEKKYEAKTLPELFEKLKVDDSIYAAIFYEALIDKSTTSEQQFGELLPAHPETLGKILRDLLRLSSPPQKDPPMTLPAAATEAVKPN